MQNVSVFGSDNPLALVSSDAYYSDDTLSADVNSAGEIICSNCPEGRMKGSDEWLDLFNRESCKPISRRSLHLHSHSWRRQWQR